MKIALLADVHGNPWALDAVAEDLRREAPDLTVFIGDAVGLLPVAGETVARLRGLCAIGVAGNGDERILAIRSALADERAWAGYAERGREVLRSRGVPEAEWEPRIAWDGEVVGSLSADDAAYLRALPRTAEVALPGGRRLLCFHGTPDDPGTVLHPLAPFEEVDRLLGGATADVFAFGHFHCPQFRRHRAALLVNPGSVGLALRHETYGTSGYAYQAAAEAEYALLTAGTAGTAGTPSAVTFRRVPYPIGAVAEASRRSGAPAPHPRNWLLSTYAWGSVH